MSRTLVLLRHGRTGHDFDGLAGTDLAIEALAGADFTDDFQIAGQIDGAHRVSVAHRTCDGGIVAVRRDGLGQDAPGSGFQRDAFGGRHGARGADRV